MSADLRAVTTLDRLIHEPARLLIVTILSSVASADFLFLQRETGLTKGNLSAHLSKLEEAGYIACSKFFEGRLPKTEYRLSAEGRQALERYLDHMEALIRATRER